MTDIVERAKSIRAYLRDVSEDALTEDFITMENTIESLRQQLADIKREWATADSHKEDYAEKLEQQLAECQAREKVLRVALKKIAAVDPGNQFSCQSGMALKYIDTFNETIAKQGRPVAYGVPNTRPTEAQPFIQVLLDKSGVQYPELLVPLYTSDSTALDTMLKQAKREALLDAADYFAQHHDIMVGENTLRRMAKKLE